MKYNLKTIIIDVKQYEIECISLYKAFSNAGWFYNSCLIVSFILGLVIPFVLLFDAGEFFILNIIDIIFTFIMFGICFN